MSTVPLFVRRLPALVGLLLLAACDTGEPSPTSVVEGTYTLPDGTAGAFRSAGSARAFRYSALGTSDTFSFGTQGEAGPSAEGEVRVSVRFSQSGLVPVPGHHGVGPGPSGRAQASFSIDNAPGVRTPGLRDSTLAVVAYADGTLDLSVESGVLRGTFDVHGSALGIGRDDEEVRLEGRFEIPYE